MNSENLFMVLDNDSRSFEAIRFLAHDAINRVDMDESKETPGAYYREIGEAVQDYLREAGESAIAADSIASRLFGEMVSHSDRYEIGKHYYQKFAVEDA